MKRAQKPQEEMEDGGLLEGAKEVDVDEQEDLEVPIASQWEESNPDDDDERPSRGNKSSKKARAEPLTPEQEKELVELFVINNIFYDQPHPDFKNRGKKGRLLEVKGSSMGLTALQVITWFKSMQTIYGKLKKKKSGQAVKTLSLRQWCNIRGFAFLESHLTMRTESRQFRRTVYTEVPPEEEDSDSGGSTGVQRPHSQASTSQASSSFGFHQPKPAVVARRLEEALLKMATRKSDGLDTAHTLESALNMSANSRAAFGHWLGMKVRGLSERSWLLFMMDIMTGLMRYYKMDAQQQHTQPPPTPHHPPPQQQYQPPPATPQHPPATTYQPPQQPPATAQAPWPSTSWQGVSSTPCRGLNLSGLTDITDQQSPRQPDHRNSSDLNTPEYPCCC